jgi:hypothetical protein
MSLCTHAQNRSTRGTKIVVVIDNNAKKIKNLELYTNTLDENQLLKKHPNSLFYIGLLEGDYEMDGEVIVPKSNAAITIYSNKEIFSNKQFLREDEIFIGNIKTKLVSNKRGEIILRIQ